MKEMGGGLTIGEKRKTLATSTPISDKGNSERSKAKRKSPGLSIVLDCDQSMPPPAPRAPTGTGIEKVAATVKPEEGNSFGWLGPQPSPQSFWQQSPVVTDSSAASGWYSPATPQLLSFSLGAADLDLEPNWTLDSPAVSAWNRPGSPSAMLAMMAEQRNNFAGLEIVGHSAAILEQAMAQGSPQTAIGAL